MRSKDPLKDTRHSQRAVRGKLIFIIAAAAILEATSLIQTHFANKGMEEEASLRAQTLMEATRLKIMDVIDQAETTVQSMEWAARWGLNHLDTLPALTRLIVQDSPVIIGSTIALVPGYDRRHPLWAPYACESGDSLRVTSLATPEYDYPSQEWFTKPVELGEGYWSEPYLDEGGGNVLMTTYSIPVSDTKGKTAAVLTADISLDWLTSQVGNIEVYPSAFSILVSREGRFMVCPSETMVMQNTLQEAAVRMTDTAAFNAFARDMLAGRSGSRIIPYGKIKEYVYYAPIERTGWSMSVVIPDTEIFEEVKRNARMIGLFQILGLLMLVLILRSLTRSQMKNLKLTEANNRMESELHIARGIQMSMLPKIFPPFPERHDLDMYAAIVPAKEVGGDLYDFFIREEKLYFCIGDVSGKGVPASLVMAVTRSLFRTVSAHEKSPQRIVTALNDSMSDMNESSMFVTLFCGVLDLTTGHLRYCNAGHNAPVWLEAGRTRPVPIVPNMALGILPEMAFQEQEIDLTYEDALFLYTDGLTEAENGAHELFGESRMMQVLSRERDSRDQLLRIQEAVNAFVGDAPQSDDLTMLCIRYLNNVPPEASERHLIIHNDIQQIPQLAEFVNTIADEKKIGQSLAMELNLALEEAVTNVIMYAYPTGSDGLVDIEAILMQDSLDFIITDSGIPFDPTAAPPADISLGIEERPVGGLGIYLVRCLMDSVRYQRAGGKNILTLSKKI